MAKELSKVIVILTVGCFQAGCGEQSVGPSERYQGRYETGDAAAKNPVVTKGMTCEDAALINDTAQVLRFHCIRCHGPVPAAGAGFGKILDLKHLIDIEKVRPGSPSTSVLLNAMENGVMPPSGDSLSDQEVSVIRKWIEYGAPYMSRPEGLGAFVKQCVEAQQNNDVDPGPTPGNQNDQQEPLDQGGDGNDKEPGTGSEGSNLASKVVKILSDKCAACHDNGTALGGLGLISNLQNLVDDGYVVANSPDTSSLLTRMKNESNPMPPAGVIDSADLKVIEDWINAGAPAN